MKIIFLTHRKRLGWTILITLFFWLGTGNISVVKAQELQFIHLKQASVKQLFDEINRQTGLSFIYNNKEVDKLPLRDYIGQFTVSYWLDFCLGNSTLEYRIENQTIFVRKKKEQPVDLQPRQLKGKVLDQEGKPMMFVNVVVKNTVIGCATGEDGCFVLNLPAEIQALPEIIIVFSFVQMKPYQLQYTGQEYVEVVMEVDKNDLEEVVVTGIYERKKESFSGSSATYSAEEMKRTGSRNVIQSLKSLDPAFNVMENNLFGSDPNKLPDIEIRGKSSVVGIKEQFSTDPNQPLFILDGFETDLQTVMDINMDRIASVTLLKDAASTAIYGSKAANGVVVIETKTPVAGKLRLSYKGDFELTIPDLSGYNLMNAAEKLQFEYLAGRYSASDVMLNIRLDSLYRTRLADVARGVNTYWLSEPLRIGFSHKHNIYAEGGDEVLRYGIGVNYNNIAGVMDASSRDMLGGNLDLIYRKGSLRFSNKLSVDYLEFANPVVSFKEFAQANPYYRKTNAAGEIEQYLEQSLLGNLEQNSVQNPLWDDHLDNYDEGRKFGVRNNFIVEWQPEQDFKVRGRFGITKSMENDETFYDPRHSMFNDVEPLKKGKYVYKNTDYLKYEGDITVSYGKLWAEKHQVNLVGGWNFNVVKQELIGFTAVGFNNGKFNRPSFSAGYPEGGKPENALSENRATSFFLNGGYAYDNRYLVDFNYRLDGSSIFGSDKKFTNTWSIGVAWNLYNESFLADIAWLDLLKLRFSVGNPGNQNFDAWLAYTTYQFNENYLNNFGNGTSLVNIGNPNLMWQKTLDKNVGLDLSLLSSRLHVVLDVYHKRTDPLLAKINMPASTGVTEINTNIGKQVNKGFSGTLKYAPVYRPEQRINWTLSATIRCEKGYFDGIGNKLDKMNEQNKKSRNYERYYDGGSPTAIWAVRSAGIDPASGRELFITREGNTTFEYSYADEVVVGNTQPKAEGVLGSVLYYKGFSFTVYLRYRWGGQVFHDALYEKVENISLEGLKHNQDKRALYDRWQNPGDMAKFKSVTSSEQTPMSSRFVLDENTLVGESFQMGYEFDGPWMKQAGLTALALQLYANNIFRFSSLKVERGIEYPFARSVSMSLSLTF